MLYLIVLSAGQYPLFALSTGQYHLEVIEGKLRWFHRNEKGETVFAAETSKSVIEANTWIELAVTYNSSKGVAAIYVDALLVKEEISDPMYLSRDWGLFAGLVITFVNCTLGKCCSFPKIS